MAQQRWDGSAGPADGWAPPREPAPQWPGQPQQPQDGPPPPPQYGSPPPQWQPAGGPPPGPPQLSSALAVISLVAGIAGIAFPGVGSVVAVGTGIAALVKIRAGKAAGKPLAIIGIGFGVLTAVMWVGLIAGGTFSGLSIDDFQGEPLALDPFQQDPRDETAGLVPGDCLDFDVAGEGEFNFSERDVVPCDVPHNAEFAGRLNLPDPVGAPFPGDEDVFEAGVAECLEVFADHVGEEYADRIDLDLFVVHPLSLGWRVLDDREVLCFITDVELVPLLGPLTNK